MDIEILKDYNIPQSKIGQLKKANIHTMEDLLHFYPKKYCDRRTLTGLREEGESVFLFDCERVACHNNRAMLVEAAGTLHGTSIPVRILWFNQIHIYHEIHQTEGKTVLVAGLARFMPEEPLFRKPARYEVAAPALYDANLETAARIYPIYKKVPSMADAYLNRLLSLAKTILPEPEETIPEQIVTEHGLMSYPDMVRTLHAPENEEELEAALRRKQWEDLLYFALRIEMNARKLPKGSVYSLTSLADMRKAQAGLPFQLTPDQLDVLDEAISFIRSGRRLNALIQGDVGSGKTIVALLLMIAFASNGYQAVLMAPTQILARQHYEKLCQICAPLNISVVYVGGGKLRVAEQRALEKNLADGSYQLIVGTQALLEEKYQFQNLALVVEDEEHKYGVQQRTALTKKAAGGTHTVTMSATPIPRSLAQTIYGDSLQLYTIRQKPAGRKPVLTGIAVNADKAKAFLRRICAAGQQAYVVCPMISANEQVEGVMSAEETFIIYSTALSDAGISVALVTGKTPKDEAQQIIDDFAAGKISVLVSTTLIEVGVDVPNATCIVIHNAERFGLAQLHQLRGRVGRGSAESFCSLISEDTENERLQAMVSSNDGFQIAQMDLQQRGAGDFLGVQQSGVEKYLAAALRNPEEYKSAQKAAKDILDSAEPCPLLLRTMEDEEQQKSGEIIVK